MRTTLIAALAFATAACSTTPYVLPPGKPAAQVMISRGQMAGNQDAHLFYRSQDWSDPHILGEVTPFQYDVRHEIEAEAPAIIATDLMTRQGSWNAFCASHVSFTPKAGRTYRVTAAGSGETNCATSVIDTQTNAAPEDLRRVEPPKR
ncbi:MAG: hypothetical protein QM773_20110 [Hyphomonadaceae bacterium]